MKLLQIFILVALMSVNSYAAEKVSINRAKSSVKWTGKKVGGAHNGDIMIKSGSLEMKNGMVVSGMFEIDMNSMTCEDLENQGTNAKLIGHLKSDDFFSVEKFPTAKLMITKVGPFMDGKAMAYGDLTIKGKTHAIEFEVMMDGDTYTGTMNIDRSKYDVRYGSKTFFNNLGDKYINDIFTLDIIIVT